MIHALANTQGQHLTESTPDSELEEAHQQAMVCGGRIKPIPRARNKGKAADDGANDD